MAAFTLSLANLNTARDNYQRIRAANLAREGLELARNIRDTNWLKIEANEECATSINCDWDYGLWDRSNDDATSTIAYNSDPNFINEDIEACFNDNTCRLYENTDGFYDHVADNGSLTNLARLINVQAICMSGDGSVHFTGNDFDCGSVSGDTSDQVGILVTSTVYWEVGNQSHQIEVVEELYNWRAYADI